MKFAVLLAFTFISMISCKQGTTTEKSEENIQTVENSTPSEFQHFEDEILKIHDEAMPKMSEIQRLSTQLREIKTKALKSENSDPAMIKNLEDALNSLRNAEQSMMDWMMAYGETKARITPDLMQTFYDRELQKITMVRTNMINAIDNANAWLKSNPGI